MFQLSAETVRRDFNFQIDVQSRALVRVAQWIECGL